MTFYIRRWYTYISCKLLDSQAFSLFPYKYIWLPKKYNFKWDGIGWNGMWAIKFLRSVWCMCVCAAFTLFIQEAKVIVTKKVLKFYHSLRSSFKTESCEWEQEPPVYTYKSITLVLYGNPIILSGIPIFSCCIAAGCRILKKTIFPTDFFLFPF